MVKLHAYLNKHVEQTSRDSSVRDITAVSRRPCNEDGLDVWIGEKNGGDAEVRPRARRLQHEKSNEARQHPDGLYCSHKS